MDLNGFRKLSLDEKVERMRQMTPEQRHELYVKLKPQEYTDIIGQSMVQALKKSPKQIVGN